MTSKQPKAKAMRRFGEVLIPREKYHKIVSKRPFPPGQHGKDSQHSKRNKSDYSVRLIEKQKLAFIYNLRETQLRRYFLKALRQSGPTGSNMLVLLECRLDNLVYRAGYGATIWAARQLVVHGHILVNGKKLDRPSCQILPSDTISLHPKMRTNVHVLQWVEEQARNNLPYLEVDRAQFTFTLTKFPDRSEIPILIKEQLIVEYYNRLA